MIFDVKILDKHHDQVIVQTSVVSVYGLRAYLRFFCCFDRGQRQKVLDILETKDNTVVVGKATKDRYYHLEVKKIKTMAVSEPIRLGQSF